MEVLGDLIGGLGVAMRPENFLLLFVGVVLGLVIGILPGLGGTSGVAILLPITVFIAAGNKVGAVELLAGLYWGALFGGVVTSILFNIPGEPWSVALLFDGYPLAKRKGRPGLALTSAFIAALLGSVLAAVLFTFFALPLAEKALEFGPPELLAVYLMAFATLVGLESSSPLKSIMMIGVGLVLASVGFDTLTGAPRLNYGQLWLLSGITFVPVTIGLFGIGEVLAAAEEQGTGQLDRISAKLGLSDFFESLRALRQRIWITLVNALIGFWIGVLPGTGATPASFLSYGIARQYSKNKEEFGKGEISGIMSPQASANAAGVGSLLPMITLGVPGSPTAAVIMAGLFQWGLTPSALLFVEQKDFVWGLIGGIYIGSLLAFVLCVLAAPYLAMIMRIPYAVITPFIIMISIVGSYTLNTSMTDVFITIIFGLIGYWLRKMKYPLAPLVVAIVLGDATEKAMRQSLIASGGSPLIFFFRQDSSTGQYTEFNALASTLMLIAIALFLLPLAQWLLRRRRRRDGSSAPAA
ncbi:MAG TPA: tripartite tricarboxylate transporter permease [Candidatus Limnocylindria bacterium]|nr:tripartite tricarboxylate transporter permease [Candidatus Limnocylindria bacterium]